MTRMRLPSRLPVRLLALAALLLVLGWQKLVLSPMGSSESKANRVTEEERTRARSLDAEIRRLKGDGKGGQGPSAAELRAAIPESPAVSSFLRAVDGIRAQTGVVLDVLAGHPVLWACPLGMVTLCALGGIVPALKAYRTPCAQLALPYLSLCLPELG